MREGEPAVTERPGRLQAVRAHAGEVSCADACGARLVTGGARELRAWCWTRGAGWEPGARAAPAHRYGVTAARWSPRGALLASGGVDGALRVWAVGRRAETLAARRVLAAPGAGAVRALCWGGEGALLLLGAHDDGVVCVWRADTGALRARLGAHEEAVHALAAPAGALLLTCCSTGVLKVFDLQDVCARAAAELPAPAPLLWEDGAHDLGALCADASRCGRAVATGGQDARVRVWRRARGQRTLRAAEALEGHGAGVTALRWGARGVLASASLDRTARVWRRGACLCVLRAHARYLTCVVLAPDLRYMITGSNDRTVRMWSLGALTLDDDLEPPCDPAAHFALGDLEGIERPVDEDDPLESTSNGGLSVTDGDDEEREEEERESGGARCIWRSRALHSGAINGIAVHGDLLATASSDGTVRTLRWSAALEQLEPQRRVWGAGGEGGDEGEEGEAERGYPVLAADLGVGGALLLCGGLDGAAQLLDVQSGAALRTLSPRGEEGAAGAGAGAGAGVRGARVSRHRPPLILLATDAGTAPLWSLADADPEPLHVYSGHEAAALCCAWGGRAVCATGGEAGELRLHAAPPRPRTLCHVTDAHDLGVQSCDFAPSSGAVGLREEDQLMLATAGSDSFVKLWLVDLDPEWGPESTARVSLLHSVAAHGGGATCVRWQHAPGCVLASGGADRWARAWRVTAEGARAAGAVPTRGAVAVALVGSDLLVLGTMTGELAVWRLPPEEGEGEGESVAEGWGEEEELEGEGEGPDPRWWGEAGVVRWLREYVTRVPGSPAPGVPAARLEAAARARRVTGAGLLDAPLGDLRAALTDADDVESETEKGDEVGETPEGSEDSEDSVWARLREELHWLRRDAPRDGLEWLAPHGLLCAASHVVLRTPVRAADGFTYDRAALHEHRQATDDVVSPMTGRRMRNARVSPNYKLMAELRAFLREHEGEGEGEGDE